jgi:hypothetical protein
LLIKSERKPKFFHLKKLNITNLPNKLSKNLQDFVRIFLDSGNYHESPFKYYEIEQKIRKEKIYL